MQTREFLGKLDHARISAAIQDAETKTTGEIRVYVQRGPLPGEAVSAAQRQFEKVQMTKTAARNGVLIFVAPRAQKFAVIGDEGVHQKCGETYWQELVDKMRDHFRQENFTQALVEAITETGALLARHFPRTGPENPNELPDDIVEG